MIHSGYLVVVPELFMLGQRVYRPRDVDVAKIIFAVFTTVFFRRIYVPRNILRTIMAFDCTVESDSYCVLMQMA